MTIRIAGISGSLRRESWNTRLLHAASARMPDGSSLSIGSIHGIPLYNADDEKADGYPDAVRQLNDAIAAADGLLIVTPEYNNSIPGVLKNAIDWLSRPIDGSGHVFKDKPVALVGATPGGWGTQLSQNAWLPVLRTLSTRHWTAGRIHASKAPSLFDKDGNLSDDTMDEKLRDFMAGFVAFVRGD